MKKHRNGKHLNDHLQRLTEACNPEVKGIGVSKWIKGGAALPKRTVVVASRGPLVIFGNPTGNRDDTLNLALAAGIHKYQPPKLSSSSKTV